MWQRIQTVFLVVVIISMVGLIFMPIWVFQPDTENSHMLYALHYTEKENGVANTLYMPYAITAMLAMAAAAIAFISIRKFKNRVLQMKLGALNSLLMLGAMVSIVVFVMDLAKSHSGGQYGSGFWMIAMGVAANFLANRFIRRDEKLVRDSERLR
jgi:glucan phosphoethanolaminetransferase (alkaline phosphatase superfamily)